MAGGIGRISGTIFGAIVIGIISNGLNLVNVSSFWQLIVKGIIILIAVIIDSFSDSAAGHWSLSGPIENNLAPRLV